VVEVKVARTASIIDVFLAVAIVIVISNILF